MGYSQKGRKELDETERLGTHLPPHRIIELGITALLVCSVTWHPARQTSRVAKWGLPWPSSG